MRKTGLGLGLLVGVGVVGVLFVPALVAPPPGITEENFRRLHVGLTEADVQAVLGPPTAGGRYRLGAVQFWDAPGGRVEINFSALHGASGGRFKAADGRTVGLRPGPDPGLLRRWLGR